MTNYKLLQKWSEKEDSDFQIITPPSNEIKKKVTSKSNVINISHDSDEEIVYLGSTNNKKNETETILFMNSLEYLKVLGLEVLFPLGLTC